MAAIRITSTDREKARAVGLRIRERPPFNLLVNRDGDIVKVGGILAIRKAIRDYDGTREAA